MIGFAGNEALFGNSGGDYIVGGAGDHMLTGSDDFEEDDLARAIDLISRAI